MKSLVDTNKEMEKEIFQKGLLAIDKNFSGIYFYKKEEKGRRTVRTLVQSNEGPFTF